MYVTSQLRQLNFVLSDTDPGVYTMNEKLITMERFLSDKGFVRLHKSYLVNMMYIKSIRHYEAELYNGEKITIPKKRFFEAKNRYLTFKGGL